VGLSRPAQVTRLLHRETRGIHLNMISTRSQGPKSPSTSRRVSGVSRDLGRLTASRPIGLSSPTAQVLVEKLQMFAFLPQSHFFQPIGQVADGQPLIEGWTCGYSHVGIEPASGGRPDISSRIDGTRLMLAIV
jgi:hypothetical protein